MDQKYQIIIVIDGGNLMSVFGTFPADCEVNVEVLDFDNARADSEDPDALDKAQSRLAAVERELSQIY